MVNLHQVASRVLQGIQNQKGPLTFSLLLI